MADQRVIDRKRISLDYRPANNQSACRVCKHQDKKGAGLYCKKIQATVGNSMTCNVFLRKPTISEIRDEAKKTPDFRKSYLSKLSTGNYIV